MLQKRTVVLRNQHEAQHLLTIDKKQQIKEIKNNMFELTLQTIGCPALINNNCTIYPLRPQACREFPLLILGKKLLLQTFVLQCKIKK